ncbi:MAG: MFS transporter [Planctomycetaceae bacterium]
MSTEINSSNHSDAIAPNAYRLLWAGFMAILAAGVGYSVRGGILGQWANQFGFSMTELGGITGGGLTGFGIVIILSSLIADKIGYGKLMAAAFLCHVVSAVLTYSAPAAFTSGGKVAAFNCLFWGMFIFAIGNGLCEAVVNPLTATLFPKNKTHYLNILHAGWPAGLVLGGLASFFMAEVKNGDQIVRAAVDWKIQMSLFMIPVITYGAMLLGQKFPKSEAATAGISVGEMIGTLAAPLMIFLLIIHAMVGYVELGTDSWISKITGSIMNNPAYGLALFVYTSLLMFALRFVAGPIVHKISPLGLLMVSGILGATGLTLLGSATTVAGCIIAATVYALGKTFLWPTMLGVVSEQFPKGGAIAIGALGAAGMLSAGLLGGPAIGFKQDYHASAKLAETPEVFERYKAAEPSHFMGYTAAGLDGAKVGVLDNGGQELDRDVKLVAEKKLSDDNGNIKKLADWWSTAKANAGTDKAPVDEAGVYGGKMALKLTAYVPATMAVCYLLLILYFKARGGYKAVNVEQEIAAESGH